MASCLDPFRHLVTVVGPWQVAPVLAPPLRAAPAFVAAAAVRAQVQEQTAPVEHSSPDRDRDASVAVAVAAAPAGVVVAAAREALQHVHPEVAGALVALHVQLAALAVVAAPAQHVAVRVEYQPLAVLDRHEAAAAAAVQLEQVLAMFAVQFLYLDPDPDAHREL